VEEEPDSTETANDSLRQRLYSDLEAAQHARRQRRIALVVVLGLLGSFSALMIVVVVLWNLPARDPPSAKNKTTRKSPVTRDSGPVALQQQSDPMPHERQKIPEHRNYTELRDEPAQPVPAEGGGQVKQAATAGEEKKPGGSGREELKKPQTNEAPPKDLNPDSAAAIKNKLAALHSKLRPDAKASEEEILATASELAALGKQGKLAACTELCDAQLSGDKRMDQIAAEVLRKINKPLYDPIRSMLKNDDFKSRLDSVREICQLSEEDARQAAFKVLLHFKRQDLQYPRKFGAKVDYPAIAEAGLVIEALFTVAANKEDLRGYLKDWMLEDSNWYVRVVSARHYPETDKPNNTVPVLRNYLARLRKITHPQRDELCLTIIQSLSTIGPRAKDAVQVLKEFATNGGSSRVREAATDALSAIGSTN
jgi:hypothetical protein